MTRDELLERLLVERYNGGGWATPEPDAPEQDDEVTCARRRRTLREDVGWGRGFGEREEPTG